MTTTIEIVTDAVNTIDLLQSIYFDKEFEFKRQEDEITYTKLHNYWETDTWPSNCFDNLQNNLEFTCKAPIEISNKEDTILHLTFHGRISLISESDYHLTLPSASNLWLSREDHEQLVHTLNNEIEIDPTEDRSTWIIEKMQQLQSIAEPYAVAYIEKSNQDVRNKQLLAEGGPVRFLRDWIWFPMIYTREKVSIICIVYVCVCNIDLFIQRGHIIDWAPKYNITGFCCPGKPGKFLKYS
jgi:hypothetical protein